MSLGISSSPPSTCQHLDITSTNAMKKELEYKVTPYLLLVCFTAASGGLLFGYDLGISGGVSTMDDFLLKFFPEVYSKKNDARSDNYCKFDNQLLTLFTSSLYFASLFASFLASRVTKDHGRRVSIITGGLFFLLGSVLDGAAQNLGMLIVGRIVLGVGLGFTNQVTGVNIITFYFPILIQTLGFGTSASLLGVVILQIIVLVFTTIGGFTMDKLGRKKLFLLGGSTMLLFLVLTGALLQWKLKSHNKMSTTFGVIGVILILLYVVAFSWSWGPLAWLVPTEIFPLEIRSVGQSINISVIMLFISITAQVFLAMLCHLKAAIFYFFGGWLLIMTSFTYFLLPETKGVPLEDIENLWKQHPFWRRYYL